MFGIHDLALLILSGLLLKLMPGPDKRLIVAVLTALVSARVKFPPAVSLRLNRLTGGLFVWLGIKLALSKQS